MRIPEFTLNAVYSMNSRGYIRMHSDTESAQAATMVGNCLFFKHYPDIGEAVYRIYRQTILYLSTVYPALTLYKPTVLSSTVIIDSDSKLSTAYPLQKSSPTKSADIGSHLKASHTLPKLIETILMPSLMASRIVLI